MQGVWGLVHANMWQRFVLEDMKHIPFLFVSGGLVRAVLPNPYQNFFFGHVREHIAP